MKKDRAHKYHAVNLKASIIDVATKLLINEGIEAITMRAIALKLDVSRASPYRHFADKHDLLCAIAQHSFESLNTSMLNLDNREEEPKFELYRLGELYVDFCLSSSALYHLMFNNTELSNNPTAELSVSAAKLFHQLETLLGQFQQKSVIKKEDVNLQANYVWSSLHGYCCLLLTQDPQKVERLIENQEFFLEKIWAAL
ncbi:TetR/AcrR family transcriptional regulator [uncultured Psychrosphaera sp.]|uniref:TetR/AcrR family transcriptional regulator n=1 Tax=uncultured Psychrosphaera sp. TaxID=1403522 RepID=UPI0026391383|nr:TetR/AcrR family transcriptional regulator [uncultured Psychrosphaera sp.]